MIGLTYAQVHGRRRATVLIYSLDVVYLRASTSAWESFRTVPGIASEISRSPRHFVPDAKLRVKRWPQGLSATNAAITVNSWVLQLDDDDEDEEEA